ncbi:PREDICTED: serum response factor-binding protein 1-like [Habropoda laboriosa]|uniref:serum response factor-binding protein 1-like n=1 Tax=Habropoda laboriosa TaxID=597456 RepID=UPI00083DDF4F|nr:PREDICTED: serum response factor-binding protein 1-like [Habropoda laboriosa]
MELNNEIVLLRQIVRQARICVINKLIREGKRLRSNHGNEKQLEKNKYKADKLWREVFALKRIKDDEISRFGIVSFENLQEILENSQTDDGTRAMAKVVRHKSLSLKVVEFREKFPSYKEYISWKERKHSSKKKRNIVTDLPEESLKEVGMVDRNDVAKEAAHKENVKDRNIVTYVTRIPSVKNKKVDETYGKLVEEKESDKEDIAGKGNTVEIAKIHDAEVQSENGEESKTTTKVISKEATVKRFTEILEDRKTEEEKSGLEEIKEQQFSNETVKFTREMDDFFLNADDATTFSSIPVFSRQENTDNISNVSSDAFKSDRIRSKKGKLYNEKVRKANGNERIEKLNNKDVFHNGNGTPERSITYWKENRKDAKEKERSIKSINVAESVSLHPSWAAKKKQQNILKQGFQGKKIKFEED